MKKSIQGDLAEGVFYEEKEFLYDDFRMNMSKHSDIFDYEGWRLTYVDKTAVFLILAQLISIFNSPYERIWKSS